MLKFSGQSRSSEVVNESYIANTDINDQHLEMLMKSTILGLHLLQCKVQLTTDTTTNTC